jgi:hypothetical protein
MTFLLFGAALLGAWLMRPALQVDHEPVGASTTTAKANDDQPPPPATSKGGRTMR